MTLKRKNQADSLHRQSIVIDGLNVSKWGDEQVYRQIHEGGVTAINATLALWEGTKETLRNIGQLYNDFETYEKWIRPVTSIEDIHAAKKENRVGIIMGFQNTSPIEDDLNFVEIFYRLGVRVMQMTYNDLNYAGAGCYERRDVGLSQFGVDLVKEMNRLGIIIDLSHVGYQTTMEVIELSEDPVWFSHANPMTLCKHVRNKSDEQLKFLSAKKGVIGATIFPPFLPRGSDSTLDDFIDVIEYLIDLVGIDGVSIGLDFIQNQTEQWFSWMMKGKRKDSFVFPMDFPIKLPRGIQHPGEFPNITEALLDRNFSREDIQKILGVNCLRLFSQVWKN